MAAAPRGADGGVSLERPGPGPALPLPSSGDIIKVIYEPEGGEAAADMDVLFFHGLQLGNYKDAWRYTWESEVGGKPVLWPREWLGVVDSKKARIMSVSYDSSARGYLSFDDIGGQLLHAIHGHKLGQGRPIFLVGHSLGGLAIKKMCVQAHEEKSIPGSMLAEACTNFCTNVYGFLFYATPHNGSDLANIGKLALRADVMNYLTVLNADAAVLHNEFRSRFPDRPLWCLYETKPLYNVKVVVSKASAILGMDNYEALPEDHISICKPAGPQGRAYTALKEFIELCLEKRKKRPQETGGGAQPVVTLDLIKLKSDFEDRYNKEVLRPTKAVKKRKAEIEAGGGVWPDSLFLPVPGGSVAPVSEAVREELLGHMRDATKYWRSVQAAVSPKQGPPLLPVEVFFDGSWAGRGKSYRLLFEPLDIANWYYGGKNADGSGHYADGIDDACEDDNGRRPGRYRLLQQQEKRAGGPNYEPESSLVAAARLKARLGERPWEEVVETEAQARGT